MLLLVALCARLFDFFGAFRLFVRPFNPLASFSCRVVSALHVFVVCVLALVSVFCILYASFAVVVRRPTR